MIERVRQGAEVMAILRASPVVALLGPRQVGKSTLARQVAQQWERGPTAFFDLESDADVRRLAEPSLTLAPLRGLVVLDEVQRLPDLFPALRVLADRPGRPATFLVLGSASPHLLKQTSETLAGRIAFHELPGFSLGEVGPRNLSRLWLRGGFPRAYTTASNLESARWRRDFVRTFLERDLPQLGVRTQSATLGRFWSMLAHVHGQVLNWSELGRSMGVSDATVRRYVDLLEGTLIVRTLKPWHENLSKRQVKAPKVYVRDHGLLHTLLDVETQDELDAHPKVGASFEGFAIQEVVGRLGARPDQCYFWRTHAGAEIDLVVIAGTRRLGFEIKLTDAPHLTPSIRTALADLRLDSVDIVHAGDRTYPLGDRVRALALFRVLQDLTPLRARDGARRPGPTPR